MSEHRWTDAEQAEISLANLLLDAKRRLCAGEISVDDCDVITQQIKDALRRVRVIALMLPPRKLRPRESAQ